MNWMYSEIWPSATWSIIDYYGEPKHAYYQMKKSFAPILLTFVQKKGGVTALTVVNDTDFAGKTKVVYGVKTLSGEVIWRKKATLNIPKNGVAQLELRDEVALESTYVFAECTIGGEKLECVYSYDMWSSCKFVSDYTYTAQAVEGGLIVHIKANSFAKGVTLRLPNNCGYTYSDNYFDLQAGEEKTVCIHGKANVEDLTVTDFAKERNYA